MVQLLTMRVSRKYSPFSLGQLICPSSSLISTVWPWWMAIWGGPTWTLTVMVSSRTGLSCTPKPCGGVADMDHERAAADRGALDCDHGKVTARSGPALLFHLFYQVEIRRRQLPQRQSEPAHKHRDPVEYDASVAIAWFRCCGSSLPSAALLDE